MQRNKSTQRSSVINEIFTNNLGATDGILLRLLDKFYWTGVSRVLNKNKTKGVSSKNIFIMLLLFPFVGVKNIKGLMSSPLCMELGAQKDVYYSLINSEKINWRKIVDYFVQYFLKRIQDATDDFETKDISPKCFIVDDTSIEKTGKTIEFVGRVFDHSTHQYVLGFKDQIVGYWDGKTFIPIDHSIHYEAGKNGTRGMSIKERRKQHHTDRATDCESMQRVNELAMSKVEVAIALIDRGVQNGLEPEYVLADSWYISDNFIKSILEIGKKNGVKINILGLMKRGRKVDLNEKKGIPTDTIVEIYESKIRSCRKFKCRYLSITANYKGTPVKIFFVKMNGQTEWKQLVTTDLSLTFVRAMKIYQIRWSIEVFNREVKQNLNFGQCQSRHFEAMVATTSISLIHYILLALNKRFESYETMGEVFRDLKCTMIELTLIERLSILFNEIYTEFLMVLGVAWNEFLRRLLSNPKVLDLFDAMMGHKESKLIEKI